MKECPEDQRCLLQQTDCTSSGYEPETVLGSSSVADGVRNNNLFYVIERHLYNDLPYVKL